MLNEIRRKLVIPLFTICVIALPDITLAQGGAGGRGGGGGAGPAQVVPTPVYNPLIFDTWSNLNAALFNTPFNPEVARISLDSTIDSEGVFFGVNENGFPITFDVDRFTAIDISSLGFTAAEVLEAQNANVTCSVVEVTLTTSVGTIGIRAMTGSAYGTGIPFESFFAPLEQIIVGASTAPPTAIVFPFPCIPIPIFCHDDPFGCLSDCKDDYDADVSDAKNKAKGDRAQNNATNDAIIGDIWAKHDAALAQNAVDFAVESSNCDPISAAMQAGVVYSALAIFADLGWGIVIQSCINKAAQKYAKLDGFAKEQAARDSAAEWAAFSAAEAAIQNQLNDDLDDALDTFVECGLGCFEICGWTLYCLF